VPAARPPYLVLSPTWAGAPNRQSELDENSREQRGNINRATTNCGGKIPAKSTNQQTNHSNAGLHDDRMPGRRTPNQHAFRDAVGFASRLRLGQRASIALVPSGQRSSLRHLAVAYASSRCYGPSPSWLRTPFLKLPLFAILAASGRPPCLRPSIHARPCGLRAIHGPPEQPSCSTPAVSQRLQKLPPTPLAKEPAPRRRPSPAPLHGRWDQGGDGPQSKPFRITRSGPSGNKTTPAWPTASERPLGLDY
jgi:hypothetical protein